MKILIVRTSSMGDLIHTLPVIEDIRQHRADIEIHWLAESAFADIPLLNPFVKKVHTIAWRRWRKNLFSCATHQAIKHTKNNLVAETFDMVIDSQGLLKSAIPARWAKSTLYGLDKSCAREPLAAFLYDHTIKLEKNKNIIWQNRQLFAEVLGYTVDHRQIHYGGQVPSNIQLDLAYQPYHLCIHAASRDDKLWTEENWRVLFGRMYQQDSHYIYITWGNEQEYQRCLRLADGLDYVQIAPKMSLLQAALLIQNARSVIGVDTGLLHLANIFIKPTIGLYISTSADYLSLAYREAWQINTDGKHNPSSEEVFQCWLTACQAFVEKN